MWSHQSQPLYDDIGRFYTILLKLLQWIGVVTDVRLRARTLPKIQRQWILVHNKMPLLKPHSLKILEGMPNMTKNCCFYYPKDYIF